MSKLAIIEQLEAKRDAARLGGGQRRIAAQHAKGKGTLHNRVLVGCSEWFLLVQRVMVVVP